MSPGELAKLWPVITPEPRSVHDLDLHGVLIARHGTLVAEEYFHGYHTASGRTSCVRRGRCWRPRWWARLMQSGQVKGFLPRLARLRT